MIDHDNVSPARNFQIHFQGVASYVHRRSDYIALHIITTCEFFPLKTKSVLHVCVVVFCFRLISIAIESSTLRSQFTGNYLIMVKCYWGVFAGQFRHWQKHTKSVFFFFSFLMGHIWHHATFSFNLISLIFLFLPSGIKNVLCRLKWILYVYWRKCQKKYVEVKSPGMMCLIKYAI